MKSILAFGVVALAITACGDNGSAAPAPATEAVATSPSPTTVVVPAPTTTGPIPTTTLSPTTTTVATEDLIKQAVQDFRDKYFACGQLPELCDPTTFTSVQGDTRPRLTALASEMSAQGLYFSQDLRGSYLTITSVRTDGPDRAIVESCWYDAGVVLGPIGPDGQPTVVNDEDGSSRYSHQLILENGHWSVTEQDKLEDLGDGDKCG